MLVEKSFHFIKILKSLKTNPGDLMISFDGASLFTKVPVEDSLTLLSQHFNKDILTLFRHVLTSTYFVADGQFYEQTVQPWALHSLQLSPTSTWKTSRPKT